LTHDPLYALEEQFVNAVVEQLPHFFTPEQLDFERDLSSTSRLGFFLQRPICGAGWDPLAMPASVPATPFWALFPDLDPEPATPISEPRSDPPPEPATRLSVPLAGDVKYLVRTPGLTIQGFIDQLDLLPNDAQQWQNRPAPALRPEWFLPAQLQKALTAIEEMIASLQVASGRPTLEIREARCEAQREQELFERKREEYAGWLVTNSTYRSELRTLQEQWGATVASLGGFPILRGGPHGQTQAEPRSQHDECAAALAAFCSRWSLEGLLTWELPLPMQPSLNPTLDDARQFGPQDGVTVALPWSVLRGSQPDFRAMLRRLRFLSVPEHLRDWICREGANGPAGAITAHRMFVLYRTLHLGLSRRYAEACEGNIERLDTAFATVLGRKVELVRKVRQQLARSLSDA
jgi:hypothetical protein